METERTLCTERVAVRAPATHVHHHQVVIMQQEQHLLIVYILPIIVFYINCLVYTISENSENVHL